MGPVSDVSLAEWRDKLDTNLTSAFLDAKYQVPAMLARGGGSLIFTGTFVGYTAGMPGMAAYAASKAGLIGLVQVLAAEFGPKGIRANAILPGGTDTPASITNAPGATPEVLAFIEGLPSPLLPQTEAPQAPKHADSYLSWLLGCWSQCLSRITRQMIHSLRRWHQPLPSIIDHVREMNETIRKKPDHFADFCGS